MYRLKYFIEEDNKKVIDFMKANYFAVIVSADEKYPAATHVPLDIVQTDNTLFFTGHIMKSSDHHKAFLKNENVLVIFNGPHSYISASWYPNPVQASTWNYMAVHAQGKIIFGEEEETKKIVEALTNKYENPDSPAAFSKLPTEYVDRLVKAIVAFTIEVDTLENVFKLSQNHEQETRQRIIENLSKHSGDNEKVIACEMELRLGMPKQTK